MHGYFPNKAKPLFGWKTKVIIDLNRSFSQYNIYGDEKFKVGEIVKFRYFNLFIFIWSFSQEEPNPWVELGGLAIMVV